MPKISNNLGTFDANGIPIADLEAPTLHQRKETNDFLQNDEFFFGMRRRILSDNPEIAALVPPQELANNFELDKDQAHVMDTIGLYALGFPLFLIGETGCGKTEVVKYMCASTRMPLYQQQGHAGLDWDDIVGRWVPQGSEFVFEYGPLALALKNGGCYLLDECASVKQGVLNALNELANGGDLTITSNRGVDVIKRTDDFRFVMTANPWDNYSGNNELNIAFLDRFMVREYKYMTANAEMRLLRRKFPEVQQRTVHDLVKFANKSRALRTKNPDSTRYVVATRTLQNILNLVVYRKKTPLEAIEDCVFSIVRLTAADEYPALYQLAKNSFDDPSDNP